ATGQRSSNHLRSRDIARLVEEGVHALEESHGMRQIRVGVECGFVHPARMNVKEAAVAHRAEDVETQAAGLFARRRSHFSQGFLYGTLFPFTRMQPDKDILLHASSIHHAVTPASPRSWPRLRRNSTANLPPVFPAPVSCSGGPGLTALGDARFRIPRPCP